MYASPLPLPAFPSPSPSASAAIAAAAAAGMYSLPAMGGAYGPAPGGVPFGYVGSTAPMPLPLPSMVSGQAPLPVANGHALTTPVGAAATPSLGPAAPVATSIPVAAVGQGMPPHWVPPPSAAVSASAATPVTGATTDASPTPPTHTVPPPKRKITRTRRRKSSPLPPADVALDQLARADLAGTTAARSRKMSASEREVMLHRRRLRNRASAARSRHKAREAAARGGAAAPASGGQPAGAGQPATASSSAAPPTAAVGVTTLAGVAAEDTAAAVATLAALPLGPTRARAAAVEAVKEPSQPGLSTEGAAERVAAVIARNLELRERNERLRAAIDTLQRAAHVVGDDGAVDGVPAVPTVAAVAKTAPSPQSPVTPMNVVCGVGCDRSGGGSGGGGGGGDPSADQSCGSLEFRDCVVRAGGNGDSGIMATGEGTRGGEGSGSLVGSSMSGMTLTSEAVQQALVRPLV
ncbi:hypothetical protein MMPV_003010 [Pyropia vietnamensis]